MNARQLRARRDVVRTDGGCDGELGWRRPVSGPLMKQFMDIEGLWASPAQAATMSILCWEHRDKPLDYAEVSANHVADRIGVGRRRVFSIYDELEALLAIRRLDPGDHGKAHDGKKQRFAITLDRALVKRAADLVAAADSAKGVVIPGSPGWCCTDHQGGDPHDTRVVSCTTPPGDPQITTAPPQDPRSKYQEYKAKEAAARLPLLGPLPSDPPALAASMRAAQAFQEEKLKKRVRGLARAVLLNPATGSAVLNGEPIATQGALVEAVKTLCGQKARSQPYLRGYGAVVHGICASEWFKHSGYGRAVVAGQAPRPRDLARGGASAQHRANLRKPWR